MLKYYILIIVILGLFTSSFFYYNEKKILFFVQTLSSQLVDLSSKELNGEIPNNVALCFDNDSYTLFADNNHNLNFDKKRDKILYKNEINNLIIKNKCYSLICSYDNKQNFKFIIKKDMFVDFIFFSPKVLQYFISFDSKACFIDFQKYLQ